MDEIKQLLELDISSVIMGIFIILSGIIAAYEIIGKISEIIGKPVIWVRNKNKDHDLIIENSKNISALSEKHKRDEEKNQKQNEDIEIKLNDLTDMVLHKEINDARWTILDFSSALSNGRKYNKESFEHIFRIYENYKDVLDKNGMKNGYVDDSMEYVREKYKELLRNGEI